MIHTVLFMRKFATAFWTLESIFFATLILQMSVQIIIPIVGPLTMGTRVHSFGAPCRFFFGTFGTFVDFVVTPGTTHIIWSYPFGARGYCRRRIGSGFDFGFFELWCHQFCFDRDGSCFHRVTVKEIWMVVVMLYNNIDFIFCWKDINAPEALLLSWPKIY